MADPSGSHGVLGTSEILARLNSGEIFRPGSWAEANVRAAGYDLRMADDFLIVPDADSPDGRRYKRGDRRQSPVVLHPGDVAFVSTRERLSMPWDLAGNIGIKFGYARQGILVLTGLLVDPGFGLDPRGEGKWEPRPDERLHFLLANVGEREVVLHPGEDKLASIQFMKVAGNPKRASVQSTQDMEAEFFSTTHARLGWASFARWRSSREPSKPSSP